jgi:hypothetical protein
MRAPKVRHMLLYRTFGAHRIHQAIPGLTAGPIACRPFGPQFQKSKWQ